MNIESTLNQISAFIIKWTLFIGRLAVAIAIAYLAVRMVRLGSISLGGTAVPWPV